MPATQPCDEPALGRHKAVAKGERGLSPTPIPCLHPQAGGRRESQPPEAPGGPLLLSDWLLSMHYNHTGLLK